MRFFSDFVASPARQGGYTCNKFWRQIEGRTNRILQETWALDIPTLILLAKYSLVASAGKKLQGGYTGNYLCDFVPKVSTLATFLVRFIHLSRRQFKGRYTCDFHLALATRQSLKKSHHQREQKMARVATALVGTVLKDVRANCLCAT